MIKTAFVGFGEVNTPIDIIINKCKKAEEALKKENLLVSSVYPITDDYEEKDVNKAIAFLKETEFDVLVVCIAGWIPTHAVVKVTEQFRHKPMVLWGLCGWMEGERIVTTADQAGTTAIRKTFADFGYKFKYIYDIIGKPTNSKKVYDFAVAASAAANLRKARIAERPTRSLTDEEVNKRDLTEIENIEKAGPIAIADYYILNNGDMNELYSQCKNILDRL